MNLTLKTIALLCCLSTTTFAQNLVVNPSFEITNTNCANFGGEGFRTDLDPSWDNANSNIAGDSCSSPDLFSACNTIFGGAPGPTNMPDATSFGIGWQYSRTGTRHVGAILYSAPFGFGDQYREYIQGHTSTPLVAGQTYCVSFYVSLSDGSPHAVSNIDVYFGNSQFLQDACTVGPRINVTPQLTNTCGVISDTMNWTRLQWNYTATGGEQYFIIGNFKNDAATTHVAATGAGFGNYFAYYFIDDVSIVPNTCCFAEINGQTNSCSTDAPFNMTASPGTACTIPLTGTWSGPGITNAANGTFSPAVAGVGTHTITFTASCGYVATQAVNVSSCSMAVCEETNGTFTVSGGVGPYTWQNWVAATSTPITTQAQCTACGYSWFFGSCLNGVMPATTCNSPAGWATVGTGTNITPPGGATQMQVIDNTGFIVAIDPNNVPACVTNPCPTITVSFSGVTPVDCFGGNDGAATASASGGSGSYTYTWLPGSLNGASQSALTAGSYTVNVIDGNSCPGTGTVSITQPATALSVSMASTPTGCTSSTGTATATPSGGTANYTYVWSPSGGIGQTANNLAAGPYSVLVTDQNGCQVTGNVTVSTSNGPTISVASSTPVACNGGTNGAATVAGAGGTGTLTYAWMPGGMTGATQSALAANTYTVTVTDAAGCSNSTAVVINQPNAIVITQGTITPADCGISNGAAIVSVTGGTGTLTYSWSPTGGTSTTASNIPSGPYLFEAEDQNGCTAQANVVVPNTNGPTVTIATNVAATCFGANDGEASVSVTGGQAPYLYAWSPTGGNAAIASNLAAGIYSCLVTDDDGCIGTVNVTVTEPTQIAIIETIVDANCGASDGGISVLANGGIGTLTYLWSPGGEITSGISNLSAGLYSVEVSDANGCSVSENYTVAAVGSLAVDITPNAATIAEGQSVQLSVTGAIDYSWTPTTGLSCSDCSNPTATPLITTTYVVTGTDAFGCTGTDQILIVVETNCTEFFVPTAFSPDGSGPAANNILCIQGSCIAELKYSIYNRWGEQVFTTEDPSICWDGIFRDKPVQSGVYAYKVYAKLFDGTEISQSGNVTVVK
ncbi:MAG: gliding motility-associated C-terminal domain-containing protein [Bacteroidota bacterium]